MAKRKPLPPRRLRMNRQQRLQSARTFIRSDFFRWSDDDDDLAAVFETASVQEEQAIAARIERELAVDAENLEGSDILRWSDEDEVPS